MYDWTCKKFKVYVCEKNLEIVLKNKSLRWKQYRGNVITHGESPESWQNKSPRWQRYGGNVIAHNENLGNWQNKVLDGYDTERMS